MVSIPYNTLFAQYRSLADQLITDVNNTTVVLYYVRDTLATANPTFDENPRGMDWLTGRIPVSEMQGRMQESGTNLVQGTTTRTIICRVYWSPKGMDGQAKQLGIKDVRNSCKMISFIADQVDITNAVYALIDGHKCTRIGEAIPHGLGERAYITTFWEIVST